MSASARPPREGEPVTGPPAQRTAWCDYCDQQTPLQRCPLCLCLDGMYGERDDDGD